MNLGRTGRICRPTTEMDISEFKTKMAKLVRTTNVSAAEIVGEFIVQLRDHGRVLENHIGTTKSQSKEIMKVTIKRITKALRNFSKELQQVIHKEAALVANVY